MAALAPDLEGVLYESRGAAVLRNVAEPLEISPRFVWTRRPITWPSTPSARWWSIQTARSDACS
jgi:hypothetical protein